MNDSFYITTAISYVNGRPHIGHAYEFVATDAIARYHRLKGEDVFYLSGVDEHSAQVEKAAKDEGLPTQEYCDRMAVVFKDLHNKLGTKLNDFIRTSEPRHHDTTKEMLRRSNENGDIYKDKYAGYYCYACEAFYQEGDLQEGKCPVHHRPAEWMEQENYFFRLSAFTERLQQYYRENPQFVWPEGYKNEMLALMDRGLQDISISRSTTQWGIPLPWDPSHVSYVWFDALSNYLTGVGFLKDEALFAKFWPADMHVIGKDINRFHSVFWPAMLMSAGLPLPKQVLVHGFIYHRGEKMSKTIGNVVDPFSLLDVYGRDSLRYFLLREIAYGQDGNYSEDSLINRYNADLANDLGNLFSRSLSMIKKYCAGVVPHPASLDDPIRDKMQAAIAKYKEQMECCSIHQALGAVWDLISYANRYIDEKAPWALAKDEAKRGELDCVLLNLAETLRVCAVLIHPIMPETSMEMLKRLACPVESDHPLLTDLDVANPCAGKNVEAGPALFPRLQANGGKA
ncbi:MAG: methionine--tRNA ligase [Candidatus Omnitrophota bacterium]